MAAAEEPGADLRHGLAHRAGLKDDLVGPDAARVVRHAACSAPVVRS